MRFITASSLAVTTLLAACATTIVNDTGTPQPAVITLTDDSGENYGVQLIIQEIDGVAPNGAGVQLGMNGTGPMDNDYGLGTTIAEPPLRPARWDFAVAPGERKIGMTFAIPGDEFANWAVVTRGRGSEATGMVISVVPGCQYQIAAKLTLIGGTDFEPIVRWVRPIPTSYGLPAATSCPRADDVSIRLMN
jgi:hypothetical protein